MKQTLFKSLFLIAALIVSSNALAEIASGTSGTCTWVISDDGVLTISPTDGTSGILSNTTSASGKTSGVSWYSKREKIKSVVIEKGVTTNTYAEYLFSELEQCTKMDLNNLDVSQTKDLSEMFYKCTSLISLNLNSWDVSNVTTLYETFYGCSSLTSLDVSKWDVSNVKKLIFTFQDCSSLKDLDVSNWNTCNITSLYRTFMGCSSLTSIDVSKWDVSNVTSLGDTFHDCSSLASIDVSNWNVSNVTAIAYMFYGCSSLSSLDLAKWNVSKVKNVSGTFQGCSSLKTLDLSGWDLSNISGLTAGVDAAFSSCDNLETLKTPTSIGSKEITLPYVMYDWDNNNAEYKKLPGGSLTLHKTKMEDAAVESINAKSSVTEKARFDAVGRKIGGMKRGLNIIKMSDGTTRKVVER